MLQNAYLLRQSLHSQQRIIMGNIPPRLDLSTQNPLLFLSIVDDQIELNYETRQILQTIENSKTSFILNYGKPLSGKSSFANNFLLHKKEAFSINNDKTIKKKTAIWLWNKPLSLPQCKYDKAYLLEWEGDFHARLMETLLSLCSFVIMNSIALPQSRKFIDDFEDLLPVVKNFVQSTNNIVKSTNLPQFVWIIKNQQATRKSIFQNQKSQQSNLMKSHLKDFEKYFSEINVIGMPENCKEYSYDKILYKYSEYSHKSIQIFKPKIMLHLINNAINKIPLWLSLYLIKVWEYQRSNCDGVAIRKMDDEIAPIIKEILGTEEGNKTKNLRLALLNIFDDYYNSRSPPEEFIGDYLAGNIPQTRRQTAKNKTEQPKIRLNQHKLYEITERPTQISEKEWLPKFNDKETHELDNQLNTGVLNVPFIAGLFECSSCEILQEQIQQERISKKREGKERKQQISYCKENAGRELFDCLDDTEEIMLKEEVEEITLL